MILLFIGIIVTFFCERISKDITERKKAEQKLIESEEKYRLILENVNDYIDIINEKFEYEYSNRFLNEGLDIKSPLEIIHPEDLEKSINALKKGFKTGAEMAEIRIKRIIDDKYLWFETRGKTFIDKNGKKKAIIISRDITKRKIAEKKLKESEEKLRKLNKELEQRIEERTMELKESEKRYRDFSTVASHEFKTPLISIIGIPQLLLKDNNLTEQQKDSLNEILHSGKKLNKLIDNLLDTSQIERKSIELIKREIEINTLITQCISDLSFLIKQKNHKLTKNIQEDIKLNIDDKKISRVLTNLISNAIKFTPSNGKIEISTQIDEENNFVFSIEDNGIGIEEKDYDLIFEKFGKIRGEEIVKYELDSHGSGLGLFISKEIIKLHGGEMWFESTGKNNGTT
ncbi:MAG: PAS domain-containing sensor histidine kinase, partial [Candidatus Lokiarchaeota archaeon]|nr:PAS domain-containing sensor histidine kinase [Candidatus Lokiarchaeota archaeon]